MLYDKCGVWQFNKISLCFFEKYGFYVFKRGKTYTFEKENTIAWLTNRFAYLNILTTLLYYYCSGIFIVVITTMMTRYDTILNEFRRQCVREIKEFRQF